MFLFLFFQPQRHLDKLNVLLYLKASSSWFLFLVINVFETAFGRFVIREFVFHFFPSFKQHNNNSFWHADYSSASSYLSTLALAHTLSLHTTNWLLTFLISLKGIFPTHPTARHTNQLIRSFYPSLLFMHNVNNNIPASQKRRTTTTFYRVL